MRNLISKIMLALLISIGIMACSKDKETPATDNGTSADRVITTAESGTWRITYFFDTDTDETANFAGYVFSFNADGTLVATKGTTTENGTWSVIDDSSNSSNDDDGNSTDDDDFIIFFNVAPSSDFEDLNDNWDIVSVTANKMELIDVSGGNGGTDLLTFEKN